jgi:hypothetical protein
MQTRWQRNIRLPAGRSAASAVFWTSLSGATTISWGVATRRRSYDGTSRSLRQTHCSPAADDGKWRVADADGATGSLGAQDDLALRKKPFATTVSGEETQFGLPIIPLTEALRKPIEIGTADRPRPEALDLDKLHALIRTRANKVVEILVDVDFRLETNKLGPILGPLAREGGRMFGTEVATQKAIAIVDNAIGELIQAFPARPAAGT